jgi:uncharacterized lipoprotein YmbA
MRKTMVAAAILSLSGCASTYNQSAEHAQLVQSAPVATHSVCAYVGDQLNCTSYPNTTAVAHVDKEKPHGD